VTAGTFKKNISGEKKVKKIVLVFSLMILLAITGCGKEKEPWVSDVDLLNKEIISYLVTMFYNLNQFKNEKSVLTIGEQTTYLNTALKASEIYRNINKKGDTLKASEREFQIVMNKEKSQMEAQSKVQEVANNKK
jgi:hypothetical protein